VTILDTAHYNKPTVQLTGTNGNVFALLGRCTSALKRIDDRELGRELAMELTRRATSSGSYDEALALMQQYVDAE